MAQKPLSLPAVARLVAGAGEGEVPALLRVDDADVGGSRSLQAALRGRRARREAAVAFTKSKQDKETRTSSLIMFDIMFDVQDTTRLPYS